MPPATSLRPRPTHGAAHVAAGAVFIALVAWADGVTGEDIGLSALYLVPVLALGWRGRTLGLLAAAMATTAWLLSDRLWWNHHTPVGAALNGGFRGVTFALLALAVDRIRCDRERQLDLNARLTQLLNHADRLATAGTLAAGIAHELGTPLNVIDGRAKLLAAAPGAAPEVVDAARVISEQAARVTRTIRLLLDFTRRRGGPRSRHDLRGIVRRAVDVLRPTAEQAGSTLEVVAADEPVHVKVDPTPIEQVLTNILVNALQAGGPGKRVRIEVGRRGTTRPDGSAATLPCVAVRDEGPGVTPEDLPHLFEPFFTTKPVGEGTGLGLAVAHGIVTEHGGWIAVESAPGAGAEFAVFLPAA